MTKAQAEWAKAHDWHIQTLKTLSGNFIVYVRPSVGETPDLTLTSGTAVMQFADYPALRAWAGY